MRGNEVACLIHGPLSGRDMKPGQIIDGDAEEVAVGESLAQVLELQGIATVSLVGRSIVRAATMGTEAIFALEFDDGSRCQVKMLTYDPPS